jgi:hypothetical protein
MIEALLPSLTASNHAAADPMVMAFMADLPRANP